MARKALLVSLMEYAVSQDGQHFCQYVVLAEMQPLGLEIRGWQGWGLEFGGNWWGKVTDNSLRL